MTVTNGYCTVDELRTLCQISSLQDDPICELAINAASRMIDSYCGWRFWQDATVVARTFEVHDQEELCLIDMPGGDGISTTTGLIVKLDNDADGTFETTLTIDVDFILCPRNAAARYPVWPYTEIELTNTTRFPLEVNNRAGVQVTAKWGFPAVPDDVKAACLLVARDMYKEIKSAAFGIADFGGDGPLRIGANRTARMLLDAYRKPAVG